MVSLGWLLGLVCSSHYAARQGVDPRFVWKLVSYMVPVVIVSSKIWLLLSDWHFYSKYPGELLQAGGSFYGGLVGAMLLVTVCSYTWKFSILTLFDILAIGLPIGHAMGRLGCFAAGCCYGKPTSLPWRIVFTSQVANRLNGTPLHVPLHPTQLYEAGAELINFFLLIAMCRNNRTPGRLAGAYLVLYGVERCVIEVFRGDPGRTLMLDETITLMQLVSICLAVLGTILLLRVRGRTPVAGIPS